MKYTEIKTVINSVDRLKPNLNELKAKQYGTTEQPL